LKHLYFIEWFVILNLGVIALVTRDAPLQPPPLRWVVPFIVAMAIQAACGIAVRCVVALARRERAYLHIIRRPAWIGDTVRLVLANAFVVYTYGWIKIFMPIVNPRLFDQELWDLDRILLAGLSPTVLLLDMFGNPLVLKAFDWSYAYIFLASTVVASAYFLSEPSRRVRVAFANGNAALWLTGAWLYVLFPSLGPAFRFPEVWFAYENGLRRTQAIQALLMRNYQNVLQAMRGEPHGEIQIVFGIAAFPSLHVAFQTYVFLWMRKLWTSGEVLFGIFALVIFLGSMITGWHYLIDGLAGIALALLWWWVFWRRAGLERWLAVRASTRV
jgi:hypothetical protein